MIRHFLSIVALAIGMMALSGPVATAAEEKPDTEAATDFIRKLADETLAVLQKGDAPPTERRDQFSTLLEKGVNTDYISRFVLGRYWRQASEEQRREFEKLFETFLLTNLTNRLAGEYENQTFTVKNAIAAGSRDVLVRSEIQRTDSPALPVEWRVRKFDQGWQIIDLKAEGVSLAITQREEYSSVAQRQGMEGLLDALRERVNEMKKKAADAAEAEAS